MSGPLHAIMRGQYMPSYQSPDERARNRAAAATVLGVALIGGMIFVGKEPLMKYLKDREVTKKEKAQMQEILRKVDNLEQELAERTKSHEDAVREAKELTNEISHLKAKAQTSASQILLAGERVHALENEKKMMEGQQKLTQEAVEIARATSARSEAYAVDLAAQLKASQDALGVAQSDAQRVVAAENEKEHKEKEVAALQAEVARLTTELDVQRRTADDAEKRARSSVERAVKSARELEEKKAELAHQERLAIDLQESVQRLNKDLEGVRKENTELSERVKEAKERERAAEA
jgi:chromosome segregation ATPase